MNKIHAKSPCCGATVSRFGQRRRRCDLCGKTWRIRLKKRGPKFKRIDLKLAMHTIINKSTLVQKSKNSRTSRSNIQRKHQAALRTIANKFALPSAPEGDLILIGDGLWFKFRANKIKIIYCLYVLAVRNVNGTEAVLLPPLLVHGKESLLGWVQAVNSIDQETRNRIKAFVCDGLRGIERLARSNKWILQRCHFHQIAQFQKIRGGFKRKISEPELREEIYQTFRLMLEETNVQELIKQKRKLSNLANSDRCPKWVRYKANEFLRRLNDFRAYLIYPELKLPSTTNTVESMNRTVRELTSRSHGFKTPDSLNLWVQALFRLKFKRTCNPKKISSKNQPN